jgi:hypothetical protein
MDVIKGMWMYKHPQNMFAQFFAPLEGQYHRDSSQPIRVMTTRLWVSLTLLACLVKFVSDFLAPVRSLGRAGVPQDLRDDVHAVHRGHRAGCITQQLGDCLDASSLREAVQHGTAAWGDRIKGCHCQRRRVVEREFFSLSLHSVPVDGPADKNLQILHTNGAESDG